MTDIRGDRAPGDGSSTALTERPTDVRSGLLVYSIGLGLAVALTVASFWAANTSLLWPAGVPLGLAVLAIAQMGAISCSFCTSRPARTIPTTY